MGKEPKAPNLTLRRIREQELRMTRVEFAEALGLKAYELGDSLEPGERYIARLESGEIRWPDPAVPASTGSTLPPPDSQARLHPSRRGQAGACRRSATRADWP
jgi:hypothetical protein